jgi:type I restriction enzyme S subunit
LTTGLIGGVSIKKFKDIKVPSFSLGEQRRIVAVLDETFAAIATATANAEKNLANAVELFEAVLDQSMDGASKGWERKSLGSLGKTVTGNTPKTGDTSNFGDFVAFIKPGDFNPDGTLDYENEGLSEVGAASSRHIANGAALMVCIGATIGKSGYAERDITANQQINALLPASGVSGKFVYYQFLTAGFQKAVLRQSGQATLPIISKSKWNDLPVWLPSFDLQLRIVDELDRLLAERLQLEELAIKKIEKLTALKQSLLHRAFSGQLIEREPLAA